MMLLFFCTFESLYFGFGTHFSNQVVNEGVMILTCYFSKHSNPNRSKEGHQTEAAKLISCHFLVHAKAGRTWDFVKHSGVVGLNNFQNLSETLVAGGSSYCIFTQGSSLQPKSLPMIDMSNNGDVANVLASVAR